MIYILNHALFFQEGLDYFKVPFLLDVFVSIVFVVKSILL